MALHDQATQEEEDARANEVQALPEFRVRVCRLLTGGMSGASSFRLRWALAFSKKATSIVVGWGGGNRELAVPRPVLRGGRLEPRGRGLPRWEGSDGRQPPGLIPAPSRGDVPNAGGTSGLLLAAPSGYVATAAVHRGSARGGLRRFHR